MVKWEYKLVEIWSHGEFYDELLNVVVNGKELFREEAEAWSNRTRHEPLNELGNDGWELIRIIQDLPREFLYFKRDL